MKKICSALFSVIMMLASICCFAQEQGLWESGEYNAIASRDGYIYYAGPYYREDGNMDALYGLRMYNTKTGDDTLLMERLCRADVVGNKLYVIGGGVSSGYWDRILVVFDFGMEYGTRIASGIDMEFSNSREEYPVFNGRVYIGHQTDMEHYEIISFGLDGNDIRSEVDPVKTAAVSSDIFEKYAIINGDTYYYKYTEDEIEVDLNGSRIEFDQPPVIYNERTMVPLRAIFEALGASVVWDGGTQTVTAEKDGVTASITIGDSYIYINGTPSYLDAPAMLINERTLVPVRAVSEAFSCKVDWDGENRTVIITSEGNEGAVANKAELYEFFVNNVFESKSIETQCDNYSDLFEDDQIQYCFNKLDSYYMIDINGDGELELVVISTPLNENVYGKCISVWDSDDEGNIRLVLSKTGQQSRAAYRYFVVKYNGKLYLLESTGENSSDGNVSLRNLYAINKNGIQEVEQIYYNSRGDKYILNGQECTEEYLRSYLIEFDNSYEIIISQF